MHLLSGLTKPCAESGAAPKSNPANFGGFQVLACAAALRICQSSIRSPQQLPQIIPEQIVQTLLQSAYDVHAQGGREVLRDIVVLEFLFSTGDFAYRNCVRCQQSNTDFIRIGYLG